MKFRRRNAHSLELVQHGCVRIFWCSRGILFDELLDFGDGPSTGEDPDDQPDEQNRCGDDSTFVTTEPSPAIRAVIIRRVPFALHGMMGILLLCL